MILIIVLSLLQAILAALASNSTRNNELFILDRHPRGRRAVLVNSDPNEPCRIYGHRYVLTFTFSTLKMPKGKIPFLVTQYRLLKIYRTDHHSGQSTNRNG